MKTPYEDNGLFVVGRRGGHAVCEVERSCRGFLAWHSLVTPGDGSPSCPEDVDDWLLTEYFFSVCHVNDPYRRQFLMFRNGDAVAYSRSEYNPSDGRARLKWAWSNWYYPDAYPVKEMGFLEAEEMIVSGLTLEFSTIWRAETCGKEEFAGMMDSGGWWMRAAACAGANGRHFGVFSAGFERLSEDPDPRVRMRLAENPCVSRDLALRLAHDPDWRVRTHVCFGQCLSQRKGLEDFAFLLEDPVFEVQLGAAELMYWKAPVKSIPAMVIMDSPCDDRIKAAVMMREITT